MFAFPSPQAWAVFKGKFKEGDKAEPATWKTRLRCALNKSPDFEEVTERSQLDISEPYKVYRIVPEEEQKSEFVVYVSKMCLLLSNYVYVNYVFTMNRVTISSSSTIRWQKLSDAHGSYHQLW